MKGKHAMEEKQMPKTTPRRKTTAILVTMLPEERARLESHAQEYGRPVQWVVRDAVRAYVDTVETKGDPRPEKLLLNVSHEPPTIRRSPGRPPKQRKERKAAK